MAFRYNDIVKEIGKTDIRQALAIQTFAEDVTPNSELRYDSSTLRLTNINLHSKSFLSAAIMTYTDLPHVSGFKIIGFGRRSESVRYMVDRSVGAFIDKFHLESAHIPYADFSKNIFQSFYPGQVVSALFQNAELTLDGREFIETDTLVVSTFSGANFAQFLRKSKNWQDNSFNMHVKLSYLISLYYWRHSLANQNYNFIPMTSLQ